MVLAGTTLAKGGVVTMRSSNTRPTQVLFVRLLALVPIFVIFAASSVAVGTALWPLPWGDPRVLTAAVVIGAVVLYVFALVLVRDRVRDKGEARLGPFRWRGLAIAAAGLAPFAYFATYAPGTPYRWLLLAFAGVLLVIGCTRYANDQFGVGTLP